ncbi:MULTISPECIES: protein-glutamate methylesterase/protein-glutamine glutaminase [Pseudorhizobium]|uniref:Protein-glutamate methylesterase/protein-glutamine glutaminase n=1 Tax=Pseudorhizobium pelagicum TaxID=1509405 RepID=A0A922NX40_9HYPH|nr:MULTISPECIES: chemotaxis response regulator protein-glutamate methylesterase [Pseudorhizobium]MBU1313935.1 chemotaxis response regulator protein-glutamate methylesterase [Alphaproteobacteria bacterium]MDY6962553.1 chemotaxis response regulator protein-glutamate methylesterase [Pseudomonadota bacterium]KEQ02315.1 chemotaxis protein CheY [Pseudorhizobium pelagicum]KEQ02365.1 chemotaxis protein CheY [Pseudorhizobium pelagicum]MBU1549151.1 chemotaxis response regulator protein-glutamate methyle|tara:strand:+ start:1629 stop:2711 length:1083 start_codon:yes stop_codon:yes gene_type:complete
MIKKIRVLIVDDSASVRQTLTAVLSADPEIEVIGTANDPFMAARKIRDDVPDVITLDVEMPQMDGITFLRKLMSQHPIPVVMCSSLTEAGSQTLMQALEAGAVDVILKPKIGAADHLAECGERIRTVVKSAARAQVGKLRRYKPADAPSARLTADAVLPPPRAGAMAKTTEMVVCVGASTGGTEALREMLEALPANAPGMVIVQHMPEKFTAAFANRLNGLCAVEIKEAADGDPVLRGHVLIAPGGEKHTLLERRGARYQVSVRTGPLVSRHRPSVDVLFRSAARSAGANAMGVIMTGMGDDGARGMLEMHEAGAFTLAQDEATSVVFGMPKEAIARGGVDRIVPLEQIAREILAADRRR